MTKKAEKSLQKDLETAIAPKLLGSNRAVGRALGIDNHKVGKIVRAAQQRLGVYLSSKFKHSYIFERFREGLEANKVVGYLNNNTEGVQRVSDEFVEVPDFHVRHKYLQLLLELMGEIKHDSNQAPVKDVEINIILNGNGNGKEVKQEHCIDA